MPAPSRHGASLDLGGQMVVRGGQATAGIDLALQLAGRISGRVLAINADVILRPGARVDGDLLVVGGDVEGARETARRAIRDGTRASEVISRLRALFSRKPPTIEAVDRSSIWGDVDPRQLLPIIGRSVTLSTSPLPGGREALIR